MFNGKVIDLLLGIRNKTRNDLVVYVWGNNVKNGNHRSVTYFLKRKNITTDKLETLCEFFNVPMEVFFLDDEKRVNEFVSPVGAVSELESLRLRCKQMEQSIADKDKLIASYEARIALMERLNTSH